MGFALHCTQFEENHRLFLINMATGIHKASHTPFFNRHLKHS
jgi:hypothetical protein